jgi:tRNA (cytidine56-2'-O)-methyltransferase
MISVLVVGKCSYECSVNLAQTARAFGASEIIFVAKPDPHLKRSISMLNAKWGGTFLVSFSHNYKEVVKAKQSYKIVYLTRFGTPINKVIYSIKTYKNLLVVITTKESLPEILKIADFDVSVTTQPHSGSSALAVLLHLFYEGRELAMHFENAKYKIVPGEHGTKM